MKTENFKLIQLKDSLKKRSRSILGVITLFSVIFMGSCSKYENGPGLSLRSKKDRVANNWKIAQAKSNGEDVTPDYNKYELNLTDNYNATLTADYVFFGATYSYSTQGTWAFVDDKEKLSFDFEEDSADAVYTILKLEEDEMWLKKNGEDLELHFVTNTN